MPRQLDMLGPSITASSTSVVGITVRLDRPADQGHRRCGDLVTLGTGKGIHHNALNCNSCGKFRGWLGSQAVEFINRTRARFGAPGIITLRHRSSAAGAGDESDFSWRLESTEMRRDEVFPSKYLKASDLNGKPVVLTIADAPLETLKSPEGKEQSKIVLYFKGAKKALPLNIANWDAVAEILGGETDDWPGGRIELFPTKTQMGGKTVDCIRIRPPRDAAAAKIAPPPKAKGPEGDDMNDAIPF